MRKIKLLGISPYSGMHEILKELTDNMEDITASCHIADLEEALSVLDEWGSDNYDVIISRGGTATLLRSHTNIPVIDVGVSVLDVLRAIRLAQNLPGAAAVMGFENITNHARHFNELMNEEIPVYTIGSQSDIEEKLLEIRGAGIRNIVCDMASSKIAQTLGFTTILITSGYESVQDAVDRAVDLAKRFNAFKEDYLLFFQAFERNPTRCLIFNENGDLLHSSIENSQTGRDITKALRSGFPAFRDMETDYIERRSKIKLLKINRRIISLHNERIYYLYVDIAELAYHGTKSAISSLTKEDVTDRDMNIFTSANTIVDNRELLVKFSHTLSPVIISGEKGIGKDQAAKLIYCNSSLQNSVCTMIDCSSAADREWNYLLTNYDSPLAGSNHTVYFRHINEMPTARFNRLIRYLKDSDGHRRNRLLFSVNTSFRGNGAVGSAATARLTEQFSCLSMYLPSLRERKDDIPMIASIYINQFNTQLGKQIVGFEAKALAAIQSFPWEYNLDQFQRIVRELMLLTTTSYIGYEATMRLLRQETSVWVSKGGASGFQLDMNQTLADINYDVVRLVLAEEDGNHTKAAFRLGIGRSTLWRILKSRE